MISQIDLHHRRCANHGQREAAARCPECKRFFCRECITEHEFRLLCASCLAKLLAPESRGKARFRYAYRGAQFLFGVLLTWLVFYFVAQTLLTIPSSFHEGIWEKEAEEWLQ